MTNTQIKTFWKFFDPVLQGISNVMCQGAASEVHEKLMTDLKSKQLARSLCDMNCIGFDKLLNEEKQQDHNMHMQNLRNLRTKAEQYATSLFDPESNSDVKNPVYNDFIDALPKEDIYSELDSEQFKHHPGHHVERILNQVQKGAACALDDLSKDNIIV